MNLNKYIEDCLTNQSASRRSAMLATLVGFALLSLAAPLLIDHFKTISMTTLELRGAAAAYDVFDAVRLLEQRRDALVQDGANNDPSLTAALDARLNSIQGNAKDLDTAAVDGGHALSTILETWHQLSATENKGGDQVEVTDTYARLNRALFVHLLDIADASTLSLDPDRLVYHSYSALFLNLASLLECFYGLDTAAWALDRADAYSNVHVTRMVGWLAKVEDRIEPLTRDLHIQNYEKAETVDSLRGVVAELTQDLKLFSDATIQFEDIKTIARKVHEVTHYGHSKANALVDDLFTSMGLGLKDRIRLGRLAMVHIAIVLAVPMSLLTYMVLLIYRVSHRAVKEIRRGTDLIAKGDLTHEIPVYGSDEFASIGEAINRQSESVRKLMLGLIDSAYSVNSAAQSFGEVATEVAKGADATTHEAAQVSSRVEQLFKAVSEIATASGTAHEDARAAGRAAADGGAIVTATVTEVDSIAQEVKSAADTLAQLHADSQAISGVVGLIRSIAEQTNLLALNAAIEAARAGESGRGFAVVADEVRNLANRTGQATQEISQAIERMVSMSTRASAMINAGVDRLSAVQSLSHQVSGAVDSIVKDTARSEAAVEKIRAALAEQRELANDITVRIRGIAERSGNNSSAVDLATRSADVLTVIANELEASVNRFTVRKGQPGTSRGAGGIDSF